MPSQMKVHHGELYVDTMQSADWSPSPCSELRKEFEERSERKRQEDERQLQLQRNRQSMIGPHPANRTTTCGIMGHHSSTKPPPRRVPDSLIAKRAVLETEFEAKMDVAKRDADRRAMKKTMRNERQFEDRFAEFAARNREIAEQANFHQEVSKVRDRKKERLYQEWMSNVFLPSQAEINRRVESVDTGAMMKLRNEQFELYLAECNKRTAKKGQKGAGVYLDNARGSGYDPDLLNNHCTIAYVKPDIGKDPLKNRQTRETIGRQDVGPLTKGGEFDSSLMVPVDGTMRGVSSHTSVDPLLLTSGEHNLLPSLVASGSQTARDKRIISNLMKGSRASAPHGGGSQFQFSANTTLHSSPNFSLNKPFIAREDDVNVKQWSTMEATPHGRYSDDSGKSRVRPPGSNKRFMRSDVIMDHFTIPTGSQGEKVAKLEMQQSGKGKRVVIVERSEGHAGAPFATDC